MLNLSRTLTALGRNQSELARYLKVSRATVSLINAYGQWPRTMPTGPLQKRICDFLRLAGADQKAIDEAFMPMPDVKPIRGTAIDDPADDEIVVTTTTTTLKKDLSMLLRKHTLTREARQHFRITRDPFTDEMVTEADVFVSDDIRAVRAAMRQTARHGGMLAVIAESGGGKSTLRHDLIEWINTSGEPVTVIEPYVLGMEDSDQKGKAPKSVDITGAVIRAVSPGTSMRASQQDRASQMHAILRSSAQIGRKHVLMIEEAHCLATPTLKHLKRFYELQDGFKKLLSIILIGQTELEWKLSEHNPEVREVVQRCEKVSLPPLDNHIEAYLRHKLGRVEMSFDAVFEADAVDEIRNRLRTSVTESIRGQRSTRMQSLCYPLAVNNLVSAALNEAVKIGAPKVSGALIAAAVRAA